jgi:hypothetical protein
VCPTAAAAAAEADAEAASNYQRAAVNIAMSHFYVSAAAVYTRGVRRIGGGCTDRILGGKIATFVPIGSRRKANEERERERENE